MAGDLLMLVMGFGLDPGSAASISITSPSACHGSSNVWDIIGATSSREQIRYCCLVRSPLEIGDTVNLSFIYSGPGLGFYPTSYIATLMQISDVLSLSSARYTNISNHFANTNQVSYNWGNPNDQWNAQCSVGAGVIPARGLAIVDVGTGESTYMQLPANIDMSAWTQRYMDKLPPMPMAWSQGWLSRSLGIYTRSFSVDSPPGAPGDIYGALFVAIHDGTIGQGKQTNAWVTMKPGYRLEFSISEACEGLPLRCVEVALSNGETHYSDENGELYFTLAPGTYDYTVSYGVYDEITGTVIVSEDASVEINLTPPWGCPSEDGTGEDTVCIHRTARCATMPVSGAVCFG